MDDIIPTHNTITPNQGFLGNCGTLTEDLGDLGDTNEASKRIEHPTTQEYQI